MSQPDRDPSVRRILSALADGDATDGEAARAFQAWRDDADARATWHRYQLIGDVLRSDDLAGAPEADESFLVALRARLAGEPVVLVPPPRAAEPVVARTRRWQGPAAMAAGFLVVVGGLNIARPFWHATNATLAASAAAASGTAVASSQQAAQAQAAADQLAPYLAAHRQSALNAPFQMPGGDLRNVSLEQSAP